MEYRFESVPAVRQALGDVNYLADEGIAGVVYLADRLQKPILVEGPAGTGKTQLAKSVAEMTGARLIRLQCYEGLDESKALYEWNYKKQLLRIQAERNADGTWSDIEEDIFSDEFLLTRPLLEAIRADDPVVLLIDEVDRVEIETEALLLEILSDYQVSIPELGTVTASQIPMVFLTSNNTRELSEALKRRCLFLHIDYPDLEREKEIVLAKVPGITESLADQVARIVRSIRQLELKKAPSVSETLDWANTLMLLNINQIRRRGCQRDHQHPAEVPQRHRQGHQGVLLQRGRVRHPDMTDTAHEPSPMLELLGGFIRELREAGIPVSLTENIDAMEAFATSPSRTARRSSTRWPPRW
jgi:MoxR-like ATPase